MSTRFGLYADSDLDYFGDEDVQPGEQLEALLAARLSLTAEQEAACDLAERASTPAEFERASNAMREAFPDLASAYPEPDDIDF